MEMNWPVIIVSLAWIMVVLGYKSSRDNWRFYAEAIDADRNLWRRETENTMKMAEWLARRLHKYGDGVERFPDRPDGTPRQFDDYRAWTEAAYKAAKED